jgi:hypothetical protein
MITRNVLREEIDKVQEQYLELLLGLSWPLKSLNKRRKQKM